MDWPIIQNFIHEDIPNNVMLYTKQALISLHYQSNFGGQCDNRKFCSLSSI